MSFSIDDAWDNCGPVARAGNAAFGVYCRLGAWVARNISNQAITSPVVPIEVAAALASPELAQKLVDAGLWEAVDGGWFMPHYLERNESAEQVAARRKRDADRKAKWRERQSASESAKSHSVRHTVTPRGVRSSFTPPKGGKGAASTAATPPHPWEDDGSGSSCTKCGLLETNDVHSSKPKRSRRAA